MKMRKKLALVLALTMLLGAAMPALAAETDETLPEEASEAAQTETLAEAPDEEFEEVIYLEDADDLLALAEMCSEDSWSAGKKVMLNADISLEQSAFWQIPSFAGTFDGNGHTISGFYLTDTLAPAGFIGTLEPSGAVKDLTLSGSVIPAGDAQFVGGLVGENRGRIENCTFTGNVMGESSTGGIAGVNTLTGSINACDVSGMVIGSSMTGGIAGCNLGKIERCVNKAFVNTVSADTGLDPANVNFDFLTDISKLTTLDISSAAVDSGGIAGYSSGVIEECSNKAAVGYPHVGYNTGGIAGRTCGYVTGCNNAAAVYGRKDVGGIAGQMEPYIAETISESALAKLERQLDELDALLSTAMQHAQTASSALTDRLSGIASSVDAASAATKDIRLTGEISTTVTAGADAGADGSVSVTPIDASAGGEVTAEGGSLSAGGLQIGDGAVLGGALHAGETSLSGGAGVSVSSGASGGANASIGAGLDAQTQLSLGADLAGLSSALSSMAGQMRMLSGELAGASDELLQDAEKIQEKLREITEDGFALLLGSEDDTLITDESSRLDLDAVTSGKVYACLNAGAVNGDIAVGGIAGTLGMEYTLDPEDDLHLTLDSSTSRKYELRAIMQCCKNTGAVTAKRNYAGGCAGKMDLGLIAQCEAYGSIQSEGGNYVGGIAGLCASTVRHSFSKCTLAGGKYVGGIVGSGVEETKTGASSTVAACYAIVTITEHEQYVGAISGALAGTFLENYFVSEDLAGINAMSYQGRAQKLSYTELLARFDAPQVEALENEPVLSEEDLEETAEKAPAPEGEGAEDEDAVLPDTAKEEPAPETQTAQTLSVAAPAMELPEEFRKFNLKFVVDGEVIYSDVFDYGDSFSDDIFPELPQKEGYFARWDKTELCDLRFDTTVTAVYEPYITALASGEIRGDRPIFFAEGAFSETDSLSASAMPLSPEAFDLAGGAWDIVWKSLTKLKVNTEVVEQWQLNISTDDRKAAHTIRYLPPSGDEEHMDVYVCKDGQWQELDTKIIGSYLTFSLEGTDAQLAIVHSRNTWWAWLILGALICAAGFFLLRFVFGKIRRRAKREPDPAQAAPQREPCETVTAEEEPVEMPKSEKKRRWLMPVLLALGLLLGICGTTAFFLLPDLLAGKGAYEVLSAYNAQEKLSMTLDVDAKLDDTSLPLTAQITRGTFDGARVTEILQDGRALYYANDTVFLENGAAYQIGAALPDYSRILELTMQLYQLVDVEAVDGVYTITAGGEAAGEVLALLLPAAMDILPDTDELRVELVTERGALRSVEFYGSGNLRGSAESSFSLTSTLCVQEKAEPLELPDAVAKALREGDYAATEILSEDVYELLAGWQELSGRDFWSAQTSLCADCGVLELEKTLQLARWLENGTDIYCVKENGYGLYVSQNTICDRSGNAVSAANAANLDCTKLFDALYSVCMQASVSCEHAGRTSTYTLALDEDAMAELSHVIAPETEKMNMSFTSGAASIVMAEGKIERVEIGMAGTVQTVLSRMDSRVAAALDFTQGEELSLPDAVSAALLKKADVN